MKKTLTTIAILLGLALGATAQTGGGLFMRGYESESSSRSDGSPMLPPGHALNGDQNANAPLGGGIVLLAGLGAAYLVGKRCKEE